jgi:hypothetical protein
MAWDEFVIKSLRTKSLMSDTMLQRVWRQRALGAPALPMSLTSLPKGGLTGKSKAQDCSYVFVFCKIGRDTLASKK